MKVSLKTVTGVSFQLDLEESVTIAETKARIADSQGANFPKDRQVSGLCVSPLLRRENGGGYEAIACFALP